jgi:hypothetical protein
MRGYFSKLIKKTGVKLGSVHENYGMDKIVNSNQSPTSPIEVDEGKLIQSQSRVLDSTFSKKENSESNTIVDKHHEIPSHTVKDDVKHEPPAMTSTNELEKHDDRQFHKLEKSIIHYTAVEPQSEKNPEEVKHKTLVFKKPITHDTKDKPSHGQTNKRYFSEIRKWVVQNPKDSNDALETTKIEQIKPVLVNETKKPAFSSRQLAEPQKSKESEISDYNISIGSINLNIEAPSKAIYKKQTPITQDIKSMSSNRTRLNRHYLRVR